MMDNSKTIVKEHQEKSYGHFHHFLKYILDILKLPVKLDSKFGPPANIFLNCLALVSKKHHGFDFRSQFGNRQMSQRIFVVFFGTVVHCLVLF